MSYRIRQEEPKHPERTMQDSSTHSKIYVQNGATAHLAIPCWYQEIHKPKPATHHSRMHHDHVGWPSPTHPDHICQSWDFAHDCCENHHHDHHHRRGYCKRYIDMGNLIPIHLSKEGYTNIRIAFSSKVEGLRAEGKIDKKKDWIVRISFDAACASAVKEPVQVDFSIFADGMVNGRSVKDVISVGTLEILPGPYVS